MILTWTKSTESYYLAITRDSCKYDSKIRVKIVEKKKEKTIQLDIKSNAKVRSFFSTEFSIKSVRWPLLFLINLFSTRFQYNK